VHRLTNFSHTEQYQIWIYVLKDPRDGAVRYVGKTRQTPEDRLNQHLKWCNLTNHTDGGDGGYGLEHSEATRAKIGIAVREDWKKNTESRSQAMRKSWANDEERRQRASEQMKALWASGRMTPSRKRR
jgi:hypothetical protein